MIKYKQRTNIMNSNQNVRDFVRGLMESIMQNENPVENYKEIQESRQELIDQLGLNIDTIDTNEIIYELNRSKYIALCQNVNLYDLANVIFLKNIENIEESKNIQTMLSGISEKTGIDGMYTNDDSDEYSEDIHGIELSKIEEYFHASKNYQLAELRGNIATFIEHYYKTDEGKKFINSYKDNIDKEMKSEFFKELFDKMNKASLIKSLHEQSDGKHKYTSGEAGCLDGFFVVFDDTMNMTFNVSSTISKEASREEDSVLRHAITSKFVSNAIIEKIDEEIKMTNSHINIIDDQYMFKKDRADVWDRIGALNNTEYKNNYIYEAIKKQISIHNIDVNTKFIDDEILNGNAVKKMIIELNRLKPDIFLNKLLDEKDEISEEKIKRFFVTDKNFKTHFISETPNIRGSKEFDNSAIKSSLDAKNLTILDLRAFLQLGALKDKTLEKHLKQDKTPGFTRGAIDYFYNSILTRRIFGKISQNKINNPNVLKKMEKFIFEEFVLKPTDDVKQSLAFLSNKDKINLNHYLKFMVIDPTDPENLPKKIEKLGLKSTEYEIVKKVNELYTGLQRETHHYKKSLEKDNQIELLNEFLALNGLSLPAEGLKQFLDNQKRMNNEPNNVSLNFKDKPKI